MAMLLVLSGCTRSDEASPLPDVPSEVQKQLAFACTHETARIPPRDPEADQLYKRARWLVKTNVLKQDPAAYPPIERLVRIATAHGHDRANIELRGMLDKDQAQSSGPVNEAIDLVQDLIKRGIPAGFYDMGWYLEHGFGVRVDKELAFKYYRKSADLGSPEGQYLVGDKLDKSGTYGAELAAIGQAMQRCAGDQGHAKSANEYGMSVKIDGQLDEAVKYYQLAASAGRAQAALALASAFSKNNKNRINDLGQATDPEREARYEVIFNFLADYEYLNPKVPELEDIVPLPPAKLPQWDGKFKWLEEHKANVPPPLPTEERIAEMARAKGLDPKTGRRVEPLK
jgi:TPR repeat protein